MPRAIEPFAGVMAIDLSTAGSTVNDAGGEVIDPVDAMMFVAPVPVLVARAAALIVDTDGALELQVTRLVTFWVEPLV